MSEKTFSGKMRPGPGGWKCNCCSPIGNPNGKNRVFISRAVRREAKKVLRKEMKE